jgi:hypothetical protein
MQSRFAKGTLVALLLYVTLASGATAQINGPPHSFYWAAILTPRALTTTCVLNFQAQVYPSSTTKTAKLVGDLSCDPAAISYGNFWIRATDSNFNVIYQQRFECYTPDRGCAGPGNNFGFGPAVTVPRDVFVYWDIQNVSLHTGGGDLTDPASQYLDPWVDAPFDHACTIGTEVSQCYRDFRAGDPEDLVWSTVE